MPKRTPYRRNVLRQRLDERGLGVAWLAERTGYSRQGVYDIIHGRKRPSRPFVDAAVALLGEPEHALFFCDAIVTTMTKGHDSDDAMKEVADACA